MAPRVNADRKASSIQAGDSDRSLRATGCYVFVGEAIGAGVLTCTHAPLMSQALSFVKRLSGLDRALFIVSPAHHRIRLT